MTEVTETQLPGVGMRHEFTTAAGERSCSSHRTGRGAIAPVRPRRPLQQLECGDAVCTQDRLRQLHDLRDA